LSDGGGIDDSEDRGGPGRFDSFAERFELVIAVLLGLAAILGALAAYQTGSKDGDTLASFQEGNRVADRASRLDTEVAAKRAEDQIVTTFAAGAVVNLTFTAKGNVSDKVSRELGNNLINQLGSPELKAANEKCNTDPDCHNLVDSKYYVVPGIAQAKALDAKADALFASAAKSGKEGDDYSLVTVFLATSLFLYGVAAVGRGRTVKLGMAGVGFVIFLVAAGLLVSV
jgi:hypothetical protein